MRSKFAPDDFTYFDLRRRVASKDIGLLFPGWQPGNERVAVFAPHDDDAVFGPGYLILAAIANGATVSAFVTCNGCGGYSSPEERDTIVATRQVETAAAFAVLGIPGERIVRLDCPDFSVWPRIGWQLPGGELGTTASTLPNLRALGITRALLPNVYREHVDHEATARIAAYDVPQVGDPVVADWGTAPPVRSLLEYAVWSDFGPEDALVEGAPSNLRANRALVATAEVDEVINKSVLCFSSQARIITKVMRDRLARRLPDGRFVELYRWFDPRPILDYQPYHRLISDIEGKG